MHHKRRRAKDRRAGCYCGHKAGKHNGFARRVKVKGLKVGRILATDRDINDDGTTFDR